MQNKFPKGQVGLLLLVVMGIVVALVMSVASRSLSDTVLSRQERESSAAFAVAETGVERALNILRTTPGSVNDTKFDVGGFVEGNYRVDSMTSYNLYVKELDVAQLDVAGFTGDLEISWTKDSPSENLPCGEGSGHLAAIEVVAISSTAVSRSYYNPYNCSPGSNNFAESNDGGAEYRSTISYNVSGFTAVRIKPIYSGATISVAGSSLPTQLYLIKSRAVGGDAQKEIEVTRGLNASPAIFDFALMAGGVITHL